MRFAILFGVALIALAMASRADAQAARTVWDLPIGEHATLLPTETFIDFACGTNGGPPSALIADWSEFRRCRAEAPTGFYEVYFRYDDEAEMRARARFFDAATTIIDRSTAAYDVPVIVSALFDGDGFLVGYRIVSDPRVEVAVRELGSALASSLRARYGEERFVCMDLPASEGETPYQGVFVKRQCIRQGAGNDLTLLLEARHLRKRGQVAAQAQEGPTEGQFESSTYFQAVLARPILDKERRLAALPERSITDREALVERAKNCPACDLRDANLKRANLAGAKLAGADLTGANLHGAILAGADLTGAKLERANLNRADVKRAKLAGAVLVGAMLFETRFDAADFTGARLDRALAGRVQMIGANLTDASLVQIDLRAGRLNNANFTRADLSGSRFDDAQLTRSVLAGARLIEVSGWRAGMVGVDLRQADARGADLFGANLRDADLSGADFSYARLTTAILSAAKVVGTKFTQAQLPAGFRPN